MNKPQKRYDAQFKRDAVELLLTNGKPLKRLADELGVCDVTLRRAHWPRPWLCDWHCCS